METAEAKLSEKEITFRFGNELAASLESGEDWLYQIEGEIDDIVRRSIAKIAFNYLAYWEGQNFVLHNDFDLTRRFIRYGETPPYPLVFIEDRNILKDEQEGKIRIGHIITVEYASDGVSILSQVSILNILSYKVCLAREYSGLPRDIRRGHFFNIYNREIWDLGIT